MPAKHMRRQLVAGCPVVHIWQEGVYSTDCRRVILSSGQNERVKLVFIKKIVWKLAKKFIYALTAAKLPGIRAQSGCSHADDTLLWNRRKELALKLLIFYIL